MAMVKEREKLDQSLRELLNYNQREQALVEIAKLKETISDFATVFSSFSSSNELDVVLALIMEIMEIYPFLNPPTLTSANSTRVCNAISILQIIAAHDETRDSFIKAQIPMYLFPCLSTTNKSKAFEYLRLTCLGVIGALIKSENSSNSVGYLIETGLVPLIIKIMDYGNELSKTVAIFIVHKILLDENGYLYIIDSPDTLKNLIEILGNMVQAQLIEPKSLRLLRHIVRCYLRLTDNQQIIIHIKQKFPKELINNTFSLIFQEDPMTMKFLEELKQRLQFQ